MYMCPQRPKALDLHEAGIIDSCEPPDMGVGNSTWSMFSEQLSPCGALLTVS